jgi:23S rRNA pseudouridine1911/1915/1917 synthase
VQGDKTGDRPLSDLVKAYIKEKYQKPGEVFLGVVHRLDRPVSGLVVFARTSKALTRLNKMFRDGDVHKTYWAIVGREKGTAKSEQSFDDGEWHTLENWLVRNEQQNKSYAYDHEVPGSKKALLQYRQLAEGDHYRLLEVNLMTGRHHQIRCQLSAIGCPIKGDLKYGARRSNPDGSISLLSHHVSFVHPVSKSLITVESPLPDDNLWQALKKNVR